MTNSHFGFRGPADLASAPRGRMNAAFRTRPERRIPAAGPQNENCCNLIHGRRGEHAPAVPKDRSETANERFCKLLACSSFPLLQKNADLGVFQGVHWSHAGPFWASDSPYVVSYNQGIRLTWLRL